MLEALFNDLAWDSFLASGRQFSSYPFDPLSLHPDMSHAVPCLEGPIKVRCYVAKKLQLLLISFSWTWIIYVDMQFKRLGTQFYFGLNLLVLEDLSAWSADGSLVWHMIDEVEILETLWCDIEKSKDFSSLEVLSRFIKCGFVIHSPLSWGKEAQKTFPSPTGEKSPIFLQGTSTCPL